MRRTGLRGALGQAESSGFLWGQWGAPEARGGEHEEAVATFASGLSHENREEGRVQGSARLGEDVWPGGFPMLTRGSPGMAPHARSARASDPCVFSLSRGEQLTGPPSPKQYSETSPLSE